jgi:hypothetical protein
VCYPTSKQASKQASKQESKQESKQAQHVSGFLAAPHKPSNGTSQKQ